MFISYFFKRTSQTIITTEPLEGRGEEDGRGVEMRGLRGGGGGGGDYWLQCRSKINLKLFKTHIYHEWDKKMNLFGTI